MFFNRAYTFFGVGRWMDKAKGYFYRSDVNRNYKCWHHKDLDSFRMTSRKSGVFVTKWAYKHADDARYNDSAAYSGMYLDLDGDIEVAYSNAMRIHKFLKESLMMKTGDDYNIVFSGKKGFHIDLNPYACGISSHKNDLHLFYKWLARKWVGDLGLDQGLVDFAVYDKRRMWRMEMTRHEDTGFWCQCIPGELFEGGLEYVVRYCKKEQPADLLQEVYKINPKAQTYFDLAYDSWLTRKTEMKLEVKVDLKKAHRLPFCVVSTINKEVPAGDRNNTIFAIAHALHSIYAMLPEKIFDLLRGWVDDLPEHEKRNAIYSACKYDGHFSCFRNSRLGELLDKGIAECPFKTIKEKMCFCFIYSGIDSNSYESVATKKTVAYLQGLYERLRQCVIEDNMEEAQLLMKCIKEYEEKWRNEWKPEPGTESTGLSSTSQSGSSSS